MKLLAAENVGGCPAHAGIDPFLPLLSRCALRLPRPRGDRPYAASQAISVVPVAPPTRG